MAITIILIAFAVILTVALLSSTNETHENNAHNHAPSNPQAMIQKKPKPKVQLYKKHEKKRRQKAGKTTIASKQSSNNVNTHYNSKSNTERVLLDDVLRLGAFIDSVAFDELLDFQLSGAKYVNIPVGVLDELRHRKSERQKEDLLLSKCALLNNKGIEYEKDGMIEQAKLVYEENIALGYPAHHSFKRLMILYRKEKDYMSEERVILRALEVFGEYPEYIDRLVKVQRLII